MLLKATFSVFGIYGCFLTWGVLQERVSTTPYYSSTGAHETFRYFVFLNTIQAYTAAFVGLLYLLVSGQRLMSSPLLKSGNETVKDAKGAGTPTSSFTFTPPVTLLLRYLQVAFLGSISSPFGYRSLKHIDYPTMILGKTCKLIPVMLMQILLFRKHFPPYKYVVVFLITMGVSSFMLLHPTEKQADNVKRQNSLFGLGLLTISLLIDGVINSTQDQIMHQFYVTGQQMMLFMNLFSALLTSSWLLLPWNTELWDAIDFCQRYPGVIVDILMFSACGALGQVFIFYVLQHFGSLFLVTVNVTRKMFSMLFSIFLFNHPMSSGQWMAIATVFFGIGLEAAVKQREKAKLQNGVAQPKTIKKND